MNPAVERLAGELRMLYEDADRPTLDSVVKLAARERPPVKLTSSTLNDWLTGTAVPRNAERFRFVIAHLQRRAAQRPNAGYRPRPMEWWTELLTRAQAEKHANRGGRPPGAPQQTKGDTRPPSVGRIIGDLDETAALMLEVHQAVTFDDAHADLRPLPPYLPRPHDAVLRAELARAEHRSRLVMLVGGSSTGKTRACWEAIRAVLGGWRVWHPLSPERPDAVVDAITSGYVGPRTVIWLNEAQMYLQPAGVGARVATELQQLLHDPAAGPVVVLGSMWPEYWTALTDQKSTEHAAARALLGRGRDITVPAGFTSDELTAMRKLVIADPRLRQAVDYGNGWIAQHLAGAPELIRRYEHADDYARAILWAAMDARRLSRWLHLPDEFLRRAAPGYLNPQVWGQTRDGDAWFSDAITYLTEDCHGAPGPLSRRKPLPGAPDPLGAIGHRLADYLEQSGRAERARYSPPSTFWNAAIATCADPGALSDLAAAAAERARYHRGQQLCRQAANRGDTRALLGLALLRKWAGDHTGAVAVAREAADCGDASVLHTLAVLGEQAGDDTSAVMLYREAADRGGTSALFGLAVLHERAGEYTGAVAAVQEAADRGDISALGNLAMLREQAGDHTSAATLYQEAADRGDISALGNLAMLREKAGDHTSAETLYQEAADRGDIEALLTLARLRKDAGDHTGAETLYREAVDRGGTSVLSTLARLREDAGDHTGAIAAAREAASHGNASVLHILAQLREEAGDHTGAETLYRQAGDRGNTDALLDLARLREQVGDNTGAVAAVQEAIDRGNASALGTLARLWEEAGEYTGAETLERFGLTDDGRPFIPGSALVQARSGHRVS